MSDGALSDLIVVELADMAAGPFCAKVMADLGAEVVKIERPGVGDLSRQRGPFPNGEPHLDCSALFLYLNTNKRGVTLDIATPEGADLLRKLLSAADIFLEATPPGTLTALGLGYEALHALNPRLIQASLSPFGQSGPYHTYKGYELNNYHFSGIGYETPWRQVEAMLIEAVTTASVTPQRPGIWRRRINIRAIPANDRLEVFMASSLSGLWAQAASGLSCCSGASRRNPVVASNRWAAAGGQRRCVAVPGIRAGRPGVRTMTSCAPTRTSATSCATKSSTVTCRISIPNCGRSSSTFSDRKSTRLNSSHRT